MENEELDAASTISLESVASSTDHGYTSESALSLASVEVEDLRTTGLRNATESSEDSVLKNQLEKRQPSSVATSIRRLQKELADISSDPPTNCSAGPKSDGNLFEWTSTILGPVGSVYEGGIFFLDILFPYEYPYAPPSITFRTRIYHCNINSRGTICLDILYEKWSPALTIAKVLLSICSLLTDCYPADPLVHSIAIQYLKNRQEHDKIARLWTKRFAS